MGPTCPRSISLRGSRGGVHASYPTAHGMLRERRSDRAANALLAYDTFGSIPGHAAALDVGAVMADGGLRSLAGARELYLLTDYVEGTVYAQDLRRLAEGAAAGPRDERRCEALARYLARLHRERRSPAEYRRSVRD